MTETARIEYRGNRGHLVCPCGTYGGSRFVACDRGGGTVTPAEWSGCTVGCPECGRILSIEGVVLGRREVA